MSEAQKNWRHGRNAKLAIWSRLYTAVGRRSLIILAGILLANAGIAYADGNKNDKWVGTWSASPQAASSPLQINGQTIRQVVHTSIGGEQIRVRLSNAYGTGSLVIDSAHVGLRSNGSSIAPGSDRVLTFNGSSSTTIPPGALAVSDPVNLQVSDLGDLAVSIYIAGNVSATTEHTLGLQTTYVSPVGDFTGAASMPLVGTATTQSFYFLTGVEVQAPKQSVAIVTLGDSITDGYQSTPDANMRWPNRLAERLQARQRGNNTVAVLNAGISGNRVLHDNVGTNALARLDRDVLTQSGAGFLIVLEGINDIGIPGLFSVLFPTGPYASEFVTADQIIAGHRQIIDRAHAMGLTVYGGTLTPFQAFAPGLYYTPDGEAKRQAVNQWIRTSNAYDAVIDFDKVIRNPSNPARILPAYDSGDNLHPNDAGYKAMADAIDLSLFK
jgi:lysophospholipase L1-like esterase